jgi:hypothetical protein
MHFNPAMKILRLAAAPAPHNWIRTRAESRRLRTWWIKTFLTIWWPIVLKKTQMFFFFSGQGLRGEGVGGERSLRRESARRQGKAAHRSINQSHKKKSGKIVILEPPKSAVQFSVS